MPFRSKPHVTELLKAWSSGDQAALDELTPVVYQELHRLAKRYLARERADHTLQASALVNEAFIRLIDWKHVRWQNRAHFFGVSARSWPRSLLRSLRSPPRTLRSWHGAHRANGSRIEAVQSYSRAIELSETPRNFLIYTDAIRELSSLQPKQTK
jgi:RNA polymerase sigma factor (TIGR02999 family)